jgi:hypothetical protein
MARLVTRVGQYLAVEDRGDAREPAERLPR